MSNALKTTALLAALTVLFILIGGMVGGEQGMVIAFLFAGLMNFASYWWSDRIVLWMYGAQEVSETEAPEFHALVRRLAQRAGLPMPRVYVIPTDTPNAFATGRNPDHAAVAATQGILRILSPDELEGVMAHELGHVRHRDILISTVAATLAGAIMMLARMAQWAAWFGGGRSSEEDEGGAGGVLGLVLLAILAPLAAMLIQMAISRAREYLADAAGAQISRKPWALADALEKLERAATAVPLEANPATAHLYIANPLKGHESWANNMFSTHPPVEERVARLRAMRIA
ncbi:MAG: zinc metalloprotease HtpX [candidate division NC10 bacterium]|nr:zinc metalloprotease HtpX [candidate division NC10 bacterium]